MGANHMRLLRSIYAQISRKFISRNEEHLLNFVHEHIITSGLDPFGFLIFVKQEPEKKIVIASGKASG